MSNIALIINREEVLLSQPLVGFLGENPGLLSTIFYTNSLPPQSNKWTYLKTSLSIVHWTYPILFLSKWLLMKYRSMPWMPAQLRTRHSIKHACAFHNVPLIHIENVNASSFEDYLLKNNIEILISMTSQIYKTQILHNPSFQIYNIHPSLLPNNKGRFPIFWAIVKGDDQGITCHKITEKLDAGEIVFQRKFETDHVKRVEEVMDILMKEIPIFIKESLEKIRNKSTTKTQDLKNSFYGPFPSKKDIAIYKSKIK